MNNLIC